MRNYSKFIGVAVELVILVLLVWFCLYPASLLVPFGLSYNWAPQLDIILVCLWLMLFGTSWLSILGIYCMAFILDILSGSVYGMSAVCAMGMSSVWYWMKKSQKSLTGTMVGASIITTVGILIKWVILCVMQVGVFAPYATACAASSTALVGVLLVVILRSRWFGAV